MDSRTISKLIRAEIWPALRTIGFNTFGPRTAHRHRGPLIDVVNFQSFNSHLAQALGCTTFSFGLNLGISVAGYRDELRIKTDKAGRPLPAEFECVLRAKLLKRSPFDHFERADIFSVDAEGRSAGACIDEAKFLLMQVASPWFDSLPDLSSLALRLEAAGNIDSPSRYMSFSVNSSPQSVLSLEALAAVRLLQHRIAPDTATAALLLDAGERLFATYLSHPTLYPSPSEVGLIQRQTIRVRKLLSESSQVAGTLPYRTPIALNAVARQHVWPILRKHGFTRFRSKMAARIAN